MNNSQRWLSGGYDLFAREGFTGIQVERLARILGLNKSGFYHYFGDRNAFIEHLLQHHFDRVSLLVNEVEAIHSFDPEFLRVMTEHQLTMLVNKQLVCSRHISQFEQALQLVNETIDRAIIPVWVKYVGMTDHPELSKRYFQLIRDVIYARISVGGFNEDFLRGIVLEAKAIVGELAKGPEFALTSQQVKSQFFSFMVGDSRVGQDVI